MRKMDLSVGATPVSYTHLAGQRIGKRCRDSSHQRYDFIAQFLAHGQPPRLAQIGCQQANYHRGQMCIRDRSLEVDLLLRLCPDDEDTIYQIVNLLVDTCATNRKLLHIAGDDKPAEWYAVAL